MGTFKAVPDQGHSNVLGQQKVSFHIDDHRTSQLFLLNCTMSPRKKKDVYNNANNAKHVMAYLFNRATMGRAQFLLVYFLFFLVSATRTRLQLGQLLDKTSNQAAFFDGFNEI